MFNTKLEVDRHVENCLKKINSELERNLRCYAFSKLYFKVGDYEQAHRYILNYLNTKPASAEGQYLLGKILEKIGKKEAALEAYRTSLQLEPKQNNLVFKVCELLASEDVNLDQSGARYYCQKAQSLDPFNPIVLQLKERLIALESKDPNDITNLLLKELETRPLDVNIRVHLLNHLMQHNKVKEAYTHAFAIEQKHLSVFVNSLRWYETVADVLMAYQKDNPSLPWQFWMTLVSVLDRVVTLSLDEHTFTFKNSTQCVVAVFNLDQQLRFASEEVKLCPETPLIREFLNHYAAQLCLHLVTLLYKQARKDLIKYKEISQICLPLLFAAYNCHPTDLRNVWVDHSEYRVTIGRWHREAAFRCSQVGHMLLSIAKDRKSSTLEKAAQSSTGLWREQIYRKIFVTRDHQDFIELFLSVNQVKIKNSFFVLCPQLIDVKILLPELMDLTKFDSVAQLVNPDSLHHYIWIGLNNKLPNFATSPFTALQYSFKHLHNCAAETLNVLDIESFIYCAVLCAQSQIDENKHTIYYNADKPNVVPAAVTDELGTAVQAKWLQAAYKMYKNDPGYGLSDIRMVLIRGIECVRCSGNHGLDVKLLVALAKIFAERASKMSKHSEIEFNEARAELYWKTALPLMEKLRKNQAISFSTKRIFEYKAKEMTQAEITRNIDDGKLFIGCQLMKKKEYEKAIAIFEVLKDPQASFNQAHIYKLMSDKEMNQNKENVTSEMRSKNVILLTKARDCLYLTLDRLRDPSIDKKHPLNEKLGSEIEKIERLLSRFDHDTCNNRNECDGMSDENVSSIESENYNLNSMYHSSYTNGNFTSRHDNQHLHSTPCRLDNSRREARPSPERLDAQLRQLAASKDSAINHILEQNKVMLETHKSLVEELKTFRDTVCGLITSVNNLKLDDIKDMKKSVDELKVAVDDLQSFGNISEIVYELRKEIADLRKDTTKIKSGQLSDEDLYVLDEEYGAEYPTINSNVSGLTPSIYSNLGRLPPAAAAAGSLGYAPPPLYPGMYPMYPYPGLGLPQAGALPFAHDSQLADFRSMSSLSHGLNQQGMPPTSYQPPPMQPQPPPQPPAGMVVTSLPQPAYQSPLAQLQQQTMTGFFKDTMTSVPGTMFTGNGAPIQLSTATVTSKALPVNVVITTSDPLPCSKTITTPQILSVTIPPQHLKSNQNKVHNYQIPLPTNVPVMATTPSVLNQSPMPITTQSLLSNVAPPLYSSLTEKSGNKNSSLGFQIEKSLSQSFNKSGSDSDVMNKSNVSSTSQEDHDPCPDFKPVIPLPDEVPVNTGEEYEVILFCERAKLFRYTNREWKERGIGDLKLLRNPDTRKVRLIMRRDQVHKICANHYLTSEMHLKPMTNNEKAYIWAANDYADEKMVVETFCVQFKTPELAKKFHDEFESAKKKLSTVEGKPPTNQFALSGFKFTSTPETTPKQKEVPKSQAVTNLGGFTFTSPPTFKPKEEELAIVKVVSSDALKSSPFASFTFGKDGGTSGTTQTTTPKTLFSMFSSTKTPTEVSTVVTFGEKEVKSTADAGQTKFVNVVSFGDKDTKNTADVNQSKSFTALPFVKDVSSKTTESVLNVVKPSPISITAPKMENLFAPVKKPESLDSQNLSASETTEEFEPTAEFMPVVPLPDLVEMKTGEENADVIFEAKAKLLRYDTAAKEWKERGIGQMKILKEDTVRLLMRREQVHKVCCNHQLLKTTEFSPIKNSPNILSWGAKDFSEGVLSTEVFAIRFKNQDIMHQFLKAVDSAKGMIDDSGNLMALPAGSEKKIKPVEPTKTSNWSDKFKSTWKCKNCFIDNEQKVNSCVACETTRHDKPPSSDSQFCFGITQKPLVSTSFTFGGTASPATSGFGDTFKPKEGSWSCTVCCVRNDADKSACVSCETPKDGGTTIDTTKNAGHIPKGVDLSTGDLKFSFGVPAAKTNTPENKTVDVKPGFGDAFKLKLGSWECKECYTRNEGDYCLSCECPKDDTIPSKESKNTGVDLSTGGLKFNFGVKTDDIKSTFTFNTPDIKGFSFSLKASPQNADEKEEIVFGSPHKAGFEFTPRSPRRQSGGNQPEEDSENSYYEEEEDNIYFKPVISLPDKVEVTTGEEDEAVLYNHRAKLYRLIDGEWKERGIGNLKILHKADTNKLRVVMRREQIHKICLNHSLTKDVKYTLKDDKTWLFCAADYSEGEIEYQKFCARFKTADIAQEFKRAVDDALKKIHEMGSGDAIAESDSDVEIISETKVTAEEEEEARRLFLPPKFMAYRQLKDCECAQCKKEDELLKPPNLNIGSGKPAFAPGSVFSMQTPPTKSFSFINAATTEQPKTLIKPSLLSGTATTTSSFTFGGTTFGTQTTPKPADTTKLFGANTGSIFGNIGTIGSEVAPKNRSIFGTPNVSSTGGNIFNVSGESVFGNITPKATPVFGGLVSSTVLGKPAVEITTTTTTPFNFAAALENKDETFKSDLSFAGLASKSEENTFITKPLGENSTPFACLGAGAPVFASSKPPKKEGALAEGEAHDEDYDPYYEPIVPLPEAIVVMTGEEDEKVLFNEKGKLYRYANKEWKERGVGQVKVLYHPTNNTYRLLLRRDAIHKIVLNQLITSDLDMKVHTMSSNAWMWAGLNYCDGQHEMEKLSVKFKNETISNSFQKAVETAMENIRKSESAVVSTPAAGDSVSEEEDYFEEDEERTMFNQKCTLSELLPSGEWLNVMDDGEVDVFYDTEIYASRIYVIDSSGHTISNTLIGKNTVMERKPDDNGIECVWTAIETADNTFDWKTLKVRFDTPQLAEQFYYIYLEGKSFAEQSDVVDEKPSLYEAED